MNLAAPTPFHLVNEYQMLNTPGPPLTSRLTTPRGVMNSQAASPRRHRRRRAEPGAVVAAPAGELPVSRARPVASTIAAVRCLVAGIDPLTPAGRQWA